MSHLCRVAIRSFSLFCLLTTGVFAGQDQWTTTGPVGGFPTNLVASPSSPATLYVSTFGGGIFQTMDGGEHWTPINSGLPSLLVRVLAIDAANPSVLYAGTYSDVLKSIDAGQTWTSILHGSSINEIVIDPTKHATLYLATSDGVLKSVDAGVTWVRASRGLPAGDGQSYTVSLAIDPSKPNQLYAVTSAGPYATKDGGDHWSELGVNGTFTVISVDSSRIFLGGYQNVSVSRDGGMTWKTSYLDTATRRFYKDPSTTNEYAATDAGLFLSTDAGQTWAPVPGTRESITAVAFDTRDSATMYAAASGPGFIRSTDRAATWTVKNAGLTAGYTDAIAIDPANPAVVYAGSAAGVFVSNDRGDHWTLSDPNMRSATTICIDPQAPSTVYAGRYQTAAKTTDGGATWKEVHPNIGPTLNGHGASQFAIDPSNDSIVYAALADSGISRSQDGGETWTLVNNGLTLGYYGFSALALAIDPTDPSTMFAASEGVAKTTDAGATWKPASDGLADANGYFVTPHAFAMDPTNPSIVYAATWRGLFRTVDGGQQWTKLDEGIGSDGIGGIAVDPSDPSTVYATTYSGGVFSSSDRGLHWTPFHPGLLSESVNTIAVDPSGRFLTAGAASGVITYEIVSRVPAELEARELPDDSSRLPHLLAQLQSAKSRPGFIVVPSGSVAGAGGAQFRSDVSIVNEGTGSQRLELIWIPANFDGPRSFQISLSASSTTTVPGFADRLGAHGLGALLVIPVDANGDIDLNASISGSSRIWTIGPKNPGTMSAAVAAVSLDGIGNRTGASAGGLRGDQDFRTNIGVVNLDSRARTFRVNLAGEHDSRSLSIDVPAMSMRQLPVPAADYGTMNVTFETDGDSLWTAYASSTNNVSGENVLVPAQ